MKAPSEELVEAVISELTVHQKEAHKNKDDENATCELCEFCKDLDDRNDKMPEEKLCAIDSIPPSVAAREPMLGIPFAIFGAAYATEVTMLARLCFLLGMKTALAMKENETLNSLMEQ